MLKSTLLKAVEAAAAEIRKFNDIEFKVSNKEGINNLVTEVDHASEKVIMDVIREAHPEAGPPPSSRRPIQLPLSAATGSPSIQPAFTPSSP